MQRVAGGWQQHSSSDIGTTDNASTVHNMEVAHAQVDSVQVQCTLVGALSIVATAVYCTCCMYCTIHMCNRTLAFNPPTKNTFMIDNTQRQLLDNMRILFSDLVPVPVPVPVPLSASASLHSQCFSAPRVERVHRFQAFRPQCLSICSICSYLPSKQRTD